MLRIIFLLGLLTACLAKTSTGKELLQLTDPEPLTLVSDTLVWYDSVRQRTIPVAIFHNSAFPGEGLRPVVLFSHGYGRNNGESYLKYSYLLEHLALEGFFVVSIQHELPDDALMTLGGDIQKNRSPFWERGVKNVQFVLNQLKQLEQLPLDFTAVTLIGHSNGGDISALYATRYPTEIERLITLDHLRVALPLFSEPRITTLRASDTKADPGVIPSVTDCSKYGIRVIQLTQLGHSDMDDKGTSEQQQQVLDAVDEAMQ